MKKKIFIIPLLCLLILSGGCDKDTKSEKTYYYPSDVLDYDVKSYDTDIFYLVKYISFDEQYINLLVYNWSPHIYTPQEWESLEDKPVSIDDKDYYDLIYHHQVANNGDYFLYICQRKSLYDYYVFEEIIINDIYKSYDSVDVKSPTYNFYP